MKATITLAGHQITFSGELDADGDMVGGIEDLSTADDLQEVLYDIVENYFNDMVYEALKQAYEEDAEEIAITRWEEARYWEAQRDWEGRRCQHTIAENTE